MSETRRIVVEPFALGEIRVPPGQHKDIRLKISETFTATPVFIPVSVLHGPRPGPRLFVMAAIHGDEINGVETIRRLRPLVDPARLGGTLVLAAVANPIAFMEMKRDLPDGRDLNRCFPGSRTGSLTAQVAAALFTKIVRRCDYGIDLHTAAAGRTNLPHLRADMRLPGVRRLVHAFGGEFVLDVPGHAKMLRAAAARRGVPVVTWEAGEPNKFQEWAIAKALDGLKNLMGELGMYPFRRVSPLFQMVLKDRTWLRARRGGILILTVRLGQVVEEGQEIARTVKPYGHEVHVMRAPFSGLVAGLATRPLTYPGSAVCHLLKLTSRQARYRKLLENYRVAAE
jgi:predicted deacylase